MNAFDPGKNPLSSSVTQPQAGCWALPSAQAAGERRAAIWQQVRLWAAKALAPLQP